jgi:hypothetical protein
MKGIAMKRLLVAVISLLIWSPAMADLVARNGANELRLMHSPCVHAGILDQLKEEWRPKFKKAQASVDRKTFYACWIDTNQGNYVVMFEDGNGMSYPITGFLDEPGI